MKKFWGIAFCLFLSLAATASDGWKGQWISKEYYQSEPNTWIAYRKTVTVTNVPKSLVARIAADTKYWLWINEKLVVFEGGLKRGLNQYSTYYDEVDIAPYLTTGDNVIAVLVWHFGKNGFSHIDSGTGGLLFDAQSPELNICSDATWISDVYRAYKNTCGPQPNYRLPESNVCFDAREEITNWNMKNFQGKLYPSLYIAEANDGPFGKLVKRPIPLWKDYGLKDYISTRRSGDTLKCRLPYNCQATPWLKVKAPAGKSILMLTDNNEIGGGPYRFSVRAEYITKEGEQEYESLGWMNGNEIWYIVPAGVDVEAVKFRETGYNADFVEPFKSNDPFYNELWKRAQRTLYLTMRDSYMDCPDRERAQWWGDEVNELGETFYALTPSAQSLATKGIYELMGWQRENGIINAPVPAGNYSKELPLQMLASVGWYGFYTQYFYSGDSSFVPKIYDGMRKYLHEVWKTDDEGLVIERNGDWNWNDWGKNSDRGVLTNCWYYLALKAEQKFAEQLGRTADAQQDGAMMKKIEQNFDKRFWTGNGFRSPNYKDETDDRSQAMAVVSGLATKDKYPILIKLLQTNYFASPYMEKYVFEALFAMGDASSALQRMKNRFTQMVSDNSYTTLWENWKRSEGTMNHGWTGGPLTLLSQKLCGIEPTSPGFATFRVAPSLGTLKQASASVALTKGIIKVNVEKKGNKLKVSLTVPEGTSAEVVFPSGKSVKAEAGTYQWTK